jgi:hypothetical protein
MKENRVFHFVLLVLLLGFSGHNSAYNFRRGGAVGVAHQPLQRQDASPRVHRSKPVSNNRYDLKRATPDLEPQSMEPEVTDFGAGRQIRDLSKERAPRSPQSTWQGRGKTGMGVMSPSSDPSPFLGENHPGYRRDRNKIPASPFVSSELGAFNVHQSPSGLRNKAGQPSGWGKLMQPSLPAKPSATKISSVSRARHSITDNGDQMRPMRSPRRKQIKSKQGKSNEELSLKPFRGKFYSRGGRPFAIDPGLLKRWNHPRQ